MKIPEYIISKNIIECEICDKYNKKNDTCTLDLCEYYKEVEA